LTADNGFLKRDREKFQECIRRWEARKKNLIDTIAQEKAEVALLGKINETLFFQGNIDSVPS